jgi:hypothetical protein
VTFAFFPLVSLGEETNLPYLYQQLKNPVYNKTFKKLFKGQHNIEAWFKEYIKNRNGVDFPGKTRLINSKPYEVYEICQPHFAYNCISIFFESGGKYAWAQINKDDGAMRFFGNPVIETKIHESKTSTR